MKLLVTTAHPSIHEHPDPLTGAPVHELLGRLLTPRHYSSVEETSRAGIPWACDNDGFNGVNEEAFLKMLARVEGLPGCRFITVPDVLRCAECRCTVDGYAGTERCACATRSIVYGDAALTAQRFDEWEPLMRQTGQPLALVLQDGQEDVPIPWERIDAVFVGGSTEFKLGDGVAAICREAKRRGKWVHWGRVNSRKRFAHILATGAADSCDGTQWARFRKTHLDKGLRWIRELLEEPWQLPPMELELELAA